MDEDLLARYHFDPNHTGGRHPGDDAVLTFLEARMFDPAGPLARSVEEAARYGRLESRRAHGIVAMLQARFGRDRTRTRAACMQAIRRDMRPQLDLLREVDVDPRRHPSVAGRLEMIASVCIMRLACGRRSGGLGTEEAIVLSTFLDDWWRDACALLVDLLEGEAVTALMENDDIRRNPARVLAALTSLLEEMTSPTLRVHTQEAADRIREAIGLATRGKP